MVGRSLKGERSSEQALLAFASTVFAFHHLPAIAGGRAGDLIDLATPVAVGAASAGVLLAGGLRLPRRIALLAVGAGVLYVDGHGIHLAANSIAHEALAGDARTLAHFWDEEFGHVEWHAGWIGLMLVFCLLRRSPVRASIAHPSWVSGITAVLLGFTLFSSTVEGGTWWLVLATIPGLAAWAARARDAPLAATVAASFALAGLLIGVWAIWQGGVPQFSEVGYI